MTGKMSVNLFKVRADTGALPLESVLGSTAALGLQERTCRIGYYDVRLEIAAPPNSPSHGNTSDWWMLDFTKLQFELGPGKVGKTAAISGFGLADDEGFGDTTSALYDPVNKYLLLQYNHSGVRSAGIQEYLNKIAQVPPGARHYHLDVRIDDSSAVRLAKADFITKIHYKVDVGGISDAHRQGDISLARALEFSALQNGEILEMTVTSKRGGHLKDTSARSLIKKLTTILKADQEDETRTIRAFEIEGILENGEKLDAINMLTPKLQMIVDGLTLGGDRQYTQVSRWIALQKARRGWQALITG